MSKPLTIREAIQATVPVLILLGAYLVFLGRGELFEPDEVRYGEIAREMLESGDYLTPHLNYVKYFEKPPLFYWVTAASMAFLGKGALALRLPVALLGLSGLLLVAGAARRREDPRSGGKTGFILASAPGYYLFSQVAVIDLALTVFLTGALLLFLPAATGEKRGKGGLCLAYLLLGLAVLTKGPVALVLAGAVIAIYAVVRRDRRALRRVLTVPGILIFAAITLPWFVAVSRANPEFPRYFFIHEHVSRFLAGEEIRSFHREPFWFFLPVLAGFFFPWILLLPRVLTGLRRAPEKKKASLLFFTVWWLTVFVFFSISSGKLPSYILPCLPPLALSVALAGNGEGKSRPSAWFFNLSGTLLVLAGLGTVLYGSSAENARISASAAAVIGAAVAAGGTAFLIMARRGWHSLLGAATVLLAAEAVIIGQGRGEVAAARSTRLLAECALEISEGEGPFYSYNFYAQGMPYHTEKRIVLVDSHGELRFGSTRGDQGAWFISAEEFSGLARDEQRKTIVILRNRNEDRQAIEWISGGNLDVTAGSGEYLLVSNQPKKKGNR